MGYKINDEGKLDFKLNIDPAKYEVGKAGTPAKAWIGVSNCNVKDVRHVLIEDALDEDRQTIENMVGKVQVEAGLAAAAALYESPIEAMYEPVPGTSSKANF